LGDLLAQDKPAETRLDWILQEGAEPPAPSPLPASRLSTNQRPPRPR
jgi:23S rRNA (adenine2030-N6)-methyltransferase